MRIAPGVVILLVLTIASFACSTKPMGVETSPAAQAQRAPGRSFDDQIDDHSKDMLREGRKIFRYDTFGSEDFWGGKVRLHQAIAGDKQGGAGAGLTTSSWPSPPLLVISLHGPGPLDRAF